MTTETDAALRAAAEAATPGPWRTWNDGHVGCPEGGWVGGIFQPTNGSNSDQRQPDAKYVALANPAAILDLLDRVQAAEQRAHTEDVRVHVEWHKAEREAEQRGAVRALRDAAEETAAMAKRQSDAHNVDGGVCLRWAEDRLRARADRLAGDPQ